MKAIVRPWARALALAALLSAAFAAASLFAFDRWVRGGTRPFTPTPATTARPPGAPAPRLWRLPDFRGIAEDGQPIDARALRGRAWVADFIYTRCTSACPMLTSRMLVLARKLGPATGLLSFSVDPAHDTPEVLAAYARRWAHGARLWRLVALDAAEVDAVAAGMRVLVDRPEGDDGDIVHSNQFFLVDADGWVRGAYASHDEGALAALVRDAATLEGGPAAMATGAAPGAAGAGERLFGELGCAGCHGDARAAPLLGGFGDRKIELASGELVAATPAYLRESILDPAARLVSGYEATMPSYRGVLTDGELDALVDHVARLPAPPKLAVRSAAVDPVCGMKVVVTDVTPRATHDGRAFAFCSEPCRDRFRAHPDRYPTR